MKRGLIVLAFVGIGLLLVPSAGTTSLAGGTIVAWGGPGPSLYAVAPDGSGFRQLTTFQSNAKRGSIAPSGKVVLFDGGPIRGSHPGDFDVQLMNVNGTGRRTLVGSPARETDARFSPDGNWVSYSREDPRTGESSIWRIRADGTGNARVTSGLEARWSPDGTRLLFVRLVGGQGDLFVCDLHGHDVRRLTRTATGEDAAGWSPDGKHLLFTRVNTRTLSDVYEMRPDGSEVTPLVRSRADDVAGAWSPAGDAVAFARQTRAGRQILLLELKTRTEVAVAQRPFDLDVTDWAAS